MIKKEKRKIEKKEQKAASSFGFKSATIKKVFDELYSAYDESYIHTDPIAVVRECTNPADQEIMAVAMSSLAFGQAAQIIRAGRSILNRMHLRPRHYVEHLHPPTELKRWNNFYYRMIRGSDVLRLLYALQAVLRKHDSLFHWFQSHRRAEDEYLIYAWARAVSEIKDLDRRRWKWKKENGFSHLLPEPQNGSACKRPNLMLRWLVRSDRVDLGLWKTQPASALIIPLDTHVHRVALNLRLTSLRAPSLSTAISITETLRQLDPNDPIKYDFAISRLGIVNDCPRKLDLQNCAKCLLKQICRRSLTHTKK